MGSARLAVSIIVSVVAFLLLLAFIFQELVPPLLDFDLFLEVDKYYYLLSEDSTLVLFLPEMLFWLLALPSMILYVVARAVQGKEAHSLTYWIALVGALLFILLGIASSVCSLLAAMWNPEALGATTPKILVVPLYYILVVLLGAVVRYVRPHKPVKRRPPEAKQPPPETRGQ